MWKFLTKLIRCDLCPIATFPRTAGHKLGSRGRDMAPMDRGNAQIRTCEGTACYDEVRRISLLGTSVSSSHNPGPTAQGVPEGSESPRGIMRPHKMGLGGQGLRALGWGYLALTVLSELGSPNHLTELRDVGLQELEELL
jgi:hypothetical protein